MVDFHLDLIAKYGHVYKLRMPGASKESTYH